MILALDTSGAELLACTLADDGQITAGRAVPGPRHQDRVIGIVDELLGGPEGGRALTAVAVVRGPGSQTGLRVGLATAAGLAYGRRLHLVPLSSLAVASLRAASEEPVLGVVSAGRTNLYVQAFEARAAGRAPAGTRALVSVEALARRAGPAMPAACEPSLTGVLEAAGIACIEHRRGGPEALGMAARQALGEGGVVAYHGLTGDYGEP